MVHLRQIPRRNLTQKLFKTNKMYILLTQRLRDLSHGRSDLSSGRSLRDKQNSNCLNYNQSLVM